MLWKSSDAWRICSTFCDRPESGLAAEPELADEPVLQPRPRLGVVGHDRERVAEVRGVVHCRLERPDDRDVDQLTGDPHAAAQLLPLVYEELRQLAAQKLAQEKPGQTLQPTALVHEAYLRLLGPACRDGPAVQKNG